MSYSRRNRLCCLAVLVFASGCTKTDADVLAGIGRKLLDRANVATGSVEQNWTKTPSRFVIDLRVKNRLRWDKALADVAIEVQTTETAVELKGTVPTEELARRAMDLAESTAGVEKVVNSLRVQGP